MNLNQSKENRDVCTPIDDQLQKNGGGLFDIFYTNDCFIHEQLGMNRIETNIAGHSLTLNENEVYLDQKRFDNPSDFTILPTAELITKTTNKPKKAFTISALPSSAISLATEATISISINPKTRGYLIEIFAGPAAVYLKGQKIETGSFEWNISDQ